MILVRGLPRTQLGRERYRRSRNGVCIAIMYHAVSNVSWQLFPSRGSHYDPSVTGMIGLLVVAAVIAWPARDATADAKR